MVIDKLTALNISMIVIEEKLKFQPEQTLIQQVKEVFKDPIRSDNDIKNGIDSLLNTEVVKLTAWKVEKKASCTGNL